VSKTAGKPTQSKKSNFNPSSTGTRRSPAGRSPDVEETLHDDAFEVDRGELLDEAINPDDAADAELYSDAAQSEQGSADDAGEAGEFGDSLGPEDSAAVADEAPVDDAPAEEAPADDSPAVDDDSSVS